MRVLIASTLNSSSTVCQLVLESGGVVDCLCKFNLVHMLPRNSNEVKERDDIRFILDSYMQTKP